jgi:hypothetical protein
VWFGAAGAMGRRDVFAVRDEVLSDGTNVCEALTAPPVLLSATSAEWVARARDSASGRRVKANPGAAEVWLQERQNGAPWRERAERLQQIEDEKAKKELFQKKLVLLARQTTTGLSSVYNARFDSGELIPVLKDAAEQVQSGKAEPDAAALLMAVQRFDMRSVSNLLKTYDMDPPGRPHLSITTRRPIRPRP